MSYNSKRWESSTQYDWQRFLEIDEDYKSIEKGLISVMSRTGTGKSMIPMKSMELDRSQGHTGQYILVPKLDADVLVGQTAEKYHSFLKEKYSPLSREARKLEIPLEMVSLAGTNPTLMMTLAQELVELNSLPPLPVIGDVVEINDGHHSILLTYPDASTFTIHIKSLYANNRSLKTQFEQELTNKTYSIYIDEFHKVQTQFGLTHGGNRYNHNLTSLTPTIGGYDRHGFDLLTELCRERKVVIFSATLDDVTNNELPYYIGDFNMLNLVVNHQREAISNPTIHTSNKEDMRTKLIQAYYLGERSVSFCSNAIHQTQLKTWLKSNGIPERDIYTYKGKDSGSFDKEKVKSHLINIFINKGTTGMDVDDIRLVNIFRELSDTGSSCRSEESEDCISNTAVQIIGRLRNGGEVYWQRSDLPDTTLYDVTQPNFETPFTPKQEYLVNVLKSLNRVSKRTPFEMHYIRPFILTFLQTWDKNKDKASSCGDDTVIKKFNKYFEREGGVALHDSLVEMQDISEYIMEYVTFEERMIRHYKDVFINTVGNTRPLMFSMEEEEEEEEGVLEW